jgi:flagellar motor protein MotB
MKNIFKNLKFKIITLSLLSTLSSLNAEGTYETIGFIGDDLETGLVYKNVRYSSFGKKGWIFGENYNRNNLSYIKPDGYTWSKEKYEGKQKDKLTFGNTNNYAFLERVNLKNDLSLQRMKDNKNEWYLEVDGGACVGENCNLDECIISVVIPKKFKISSYESLEQKSDKYEYNKDANFKIIDNTVTLYTKNIKGAYMRLWIQDLTSTSEIYNDVSQSLEKFSEISVYKTDTETKIVMPMDNVFASGKAESNQTGKEWLAALSSTLKNKNYKEIRVEGHTDNIPIKGIYPSNWELSSARASSSVRFMIENGMDTNKIVAIGYADTRPLVDNNSDDNRAKNRRVEIIIVGNSDTK